jgi:hypothetical protein
MGVKSRTEHITATKLYVSDLKADMPKSRIKVAYKFISQVQDGIRPVVTDSQPILELTCEDKTQK